MDKPIRFTFLFCLVFVLNGCATVEMPEATPAPTQEVWHVVYPSELAWITADFNACLIDLPGYALVIEENQQVNQFVSTADILFSWGDIDPLERQAFQMENDGIAVIVNTQNPLEDLDVDTLRQIYMGELTGWEALDTNFNTEIQVWTYVEHLSVQKAFEAAIGSVNFSAKIETWIAPDVFAMLDAVAGTPEAIGFIPATWDVQDDRVKVVGEVQSAVVPIVVLTPAEPSCA